MEKKEKRRSSRPTRRLLYTESRVGDETVIRVEELDGQQTGEVVYVE